MAAIKLLQILGVNLLQFFPVFLGKCKSLHRLLATVNKYITIIFFTISLGLQGATVGRPCTRTGEGCTGELRPLRVQGRVANSFQDFPARSAKNLGLF
jgi:hypothetical protein